MPINWTKRAVRNLESVLDYIARDNELAAVKFRDFIIDKVPVLEQHPHMGRTCDVQGARELLIFSKNMTPYSAGNRLSCFMQLSIVIHENYMVVYRVRNEVLEILRIRHARKKFP